MKTSKSPAPEKALDASTHGKESGPPLSQTAHIAAVHEATEEPHALVMVLVGDSLLGDSPEDRSRNLGAVHWLAQEMYFRQADAIADARRRRGLPVLPTGLDESERASDQDMEDECGTQPWFETVLSVLGHTEQVIREVVRGEGSSSLGSTEAEQSLALGEIWLLTRLGFQTLRKMIDTARFTLRYEALGPADSEASEACAAH